MEFLELLIRGLFTFAGVFAFTFTTGWGLLAGALYASRRRGPIRIIIKGEDK